MRPRVDELWVFSPGVPAEHLEPCHPCLADSPMHWAVRTPLDVSNLHFECRLE